MVLKCHFFTKAHPEYLGYRLLQLKVDNKSPGKSTEVRNQAKRRLPLKGSEQELGIEMLLSPTVELPGYWILVFSALLAFLQERSNETFAIESCYAHPRNLGNNISLRIKFLNSLYFFQSKYHLRFLSIGILVSILHCLEASDLTCFALQHHGSSGEST